MPLVPQQNPSIFIPTKNLSSKTIKNYIKLISAILNKAIEWDYIQNNVAEKVSIPKNFSKQKKKVILYSMKKFLLF
ncbi:MAG: phage integrase SAM-like domain-containing protein [Clostridia bacterium]|nr:phage integrase SAM-like domain-containing protein [Clostridia bacterium]